MPQTNYPVGRIFLSTSVTRALLVFWLSFLCIANSPLAFADEYDSSYQDSNSQASAFDDVNNTQGLLILNAINDSLDIGITKTINRSQLEFTEKVAQSEYERHAELERQAKSSTMTLPIDQALLDSIGTQESTGHSICCPGFACAYGDAIIYGVANDHSFYGCYSCVWTNWGGGNSSFRSLGSNEALLKEAYEQLQSGKPTVIHVTAGWGEHWITLVGYKDVQTSDNLTLDNFYALDPWDGALIEASERYQLFGDFCEHISS